MSCDDDDDDDVSVDRYNYPELFDSVLDATEIWAENMSYNTRFEQQRELEKTQMKVALPHLFVSS